MNVYVNVVFKCACTSIIYVHNFQKLKDETINLTIVQTGADILGQAV